MTKADLIRDLTFVPDDATVDVRVRVIGADIQVTAVGRLRNTYYDQASNAVLLNGEELTKGGDAT